MTKRSQDLKALRSLYPEMDRYFTPFERRFLRAGLFIALHEYGFTPTQFFQRIERNPQEAAQFIYTYLKSADSLRKPVAEDLAALDQNPEKMKVLSKILTKFSGLIHARL